MSTNMTGFRCFFLKSCALDGSTICQACQGLRIHRLPGGCGMNVLTYGAADGSD